MVARSAALSVMLAAMALAGCEIRRDDQADTASPSIEAPVPGETQRQAAADPAAPEPDPEPMALVIGFPAGGTQLDADAQRALQIMMASPQVGQGWPIVLRGHTDSGGSDSANLIASRQRAEEVAGWLVDEGIAQERIEIIAFGEHRPIEPNARNDGTASEFGRARNRRVEIWIGAPGTEPDETTHWLSTMGGTERIPNGGA